MKKNKLRCLDLLNGFLNDEAKHIAVKSVRELIEDRIANIRFKVGVYEAISKQTHSEYAKGFESGRLHRLVNERYFLQDVLLDKIKGN